MRPLALLCLFALSALTAAEDKVSYAKFARDYAAKNPTTMILLLGHCGMWDDDSFDDFVKIANLLKQDGWTTPTASKHVEKAGKK